MSNIKISFDEATPAQLRYYAEQVLGLDGIKVGQHAAHLIGKIQAANPDLTEIEVPDTLAEMTDAPGRVPAQSNAAPSTPVPSKIPAGRAGLHFKYDPKVKVNILPTNDKTRAKRVFVGVNGDVLEIQRGRPVDIPYRFYEALNSAVETQPRETDEINPATGLPYIEFIEQPSYPFSVLSMPPAEAIAAWRERTDSASL